MGAVVRDPLSVRNARRVIQLPAELLLAKQLADALKTPICLVDADGNPVHYNEAAETLLGHGRAGIEALTPAELGARLAFTNIEGTPIPVEQLPVTIALQELRPAHRWLDVIDLHGVRQRVEATAFPVKGDDGELLGAVALFWQAELF